MTVAKFNRRDFIRLSAQTGGVLGLLPKPDVQASPQEKVQESPAYATSSDSSRPLDSTYRGPGLNHISFPMGGMGAGMICLEGTGALSKFSLRHKPCLDREVQVFAAVSVTEGHGGALVLEGPIPEWKLAPRFPGAFPGGAQGEGSTGCWGLPRFRNAEFHSRFPFASVYLKDDDFPLEVELTGWSPFYPGNADNASLPVAAVEYKFVNRSPDSLTAVFSFNAANFLADSETHSPPRDRIQPTPGGFVLYGPGAHGQPWNEAHLAAWVSDANAKVDHAWFRSGGLEVYGLSESLGLLWKDIQQGKCPQHDPIEASTPGASLFLPFTLAAGESKTITLHLAWYVPRSNLSVGARELPSEDNDAPNSGPTYRPWYSSRFADIHDVVSYWRDRYQSLKSSTEKFTATFYDSTLPPEVIDAVASNLTILKSPTILRQVDGRLCGYEGSNDSTAVGFGSSHVWNYAQAIAHIFPELERGLRETEFGINQNEEGHQYSSTAIPIRPIAQWHADPSAVDGQLGGILKFYRDWRISGDTGWLRRWWPRIRGSLNYSIRTWDPNGRGVIEEVHATTYDVSFWGADGMCTSLYAAALKAAVVMGEALRENIDRYTELLNNAIRHAEERLFNGEYFFQATEWKALREPFTLKDPGEFGIPRSPEALDLVRREGPPFQYGQGCLSDGVLGSWHCFVSGLEDPWDSAKVKQHLAAVHKYNFKRTLESHVNLARNFLAYGHESGLVLCTWPKGNRPTRPFFYAEECWTGIEYQVASHLISSGKVSEGLEIVRACRSRYNGQLRNPFSELEWGHWYMRAMSSYALLQACSGARFDAVDKVLYLNPAIKGDFRGFLSTATGFATVGVQNGKPFLEVVSGEIPCDRIAYVAA